MNERVAEMKEMHLAGASLEAIGNSFGISRQRVWSILKVNGIPTKREKKVKAEKAERKKLSVYEKFELRVNKMDNGCWLWTGANNGGGYGVMRDGEKTVYVVQVAWSINHPGSSLTPGKITHTCGNENCCNPEHLKER